MYIHEVKPPFSNSQKVDVSLGEFTAHRQYGKLPIYLDDYKLQII